jgi:uncharacterized membrane protein YbhN (UPF0104 family)
VRRQLDLKLDPFQEAVVAVRSRPRLAIGAVVVIVVVCLGAWFLGGGRMSLAAASDVKPRQELTAVLATMASLLASAIGWRVAFGALGARIGALDACSRYAAGSLVNACCPARLGDAVRGALFARSLPSRDGRLYVAAGAFGAVGLSQGLVRVLTIGCGTVIGAVPLWPVLAIGALVTSGVMFALVLDRRRGGPRLGRLAEATATLVRRPRLGFTLLFWSLVAVGGQLVAATAVASGLGIRSPLLAALAITAALDVASAVPLTPGGLGIASGAVSLALASRGVSLSTSIASGLVLQATTTAAGLLFAGIAIPLAARPRLAGHPATRLAGALAGAAALATVGSILATNLA